MPIATPRLIGYRSRPEPLWSSREAFFTEAALFILGAAGFYSLSIVGALPGSEALLLPMLPVLLLARGRRAFDRQYLMFYILAGGWFLGTQIADTYNGIPAFNRMKGTARVAFFIFDFMALAIFINNKTRRIVIFALSIAAVLIIASLMFSAEFMLRWKFGVSQGLAIIALLGSSYYYARRRYRICFLISLVLAGLNLRYGFRSQLGVHFVAMVLIWPLSAQARNLPGGSRTVQAKTRILLLLVVAAAAGYAANAAIKYAAQRGFFEESENEKFLGQAEGDYGVLVGGRPETLVAIQAIRDSPIIGHGSFPYGLKYMQLKQDIQYEHGYSDSDDPEQVDYPVIPTHSHLTLAWVEGGILGGICWIYILILTLRALLRLSTLHPPLAPLYSYLLVGFVWDILYSPFGSVNRIRAAFYILLSYSILKLPVAAALRVRGPQVLVSRRRPLRLASRAAH
jgi:hypothetical protein